MRFSKLAREIYGRYTDLIGTVRNGRGLGRCYRMSAYIGTPLHIAEKIKESIKYELD